MGLYSGHNKVRYHADLTNAEAWCAAIDEYWRVPVAKPVHNENVVSDTRYGVPRCAKFNPHYIHKDIVRVRRFGRKWSIVE